MFWAKVYLAVFLLVSLGGFVIDARKRRTPAEITVNILTVAAPALLVLAYLEPQLFVYKGTLLALFAITLATNWIAGNMYLREMNDEAPEEEALNFWSMAVSVIVILLPAFWYGMLAYTRG